jgi:membrane-associated phospholipid phosphatase
VQEAVAQRSFEQAREAIYWQSSATSTLWDSLAADLIARYQLDLPHAARVLALIGVAVADAEIACWDAKYTYWTARPITVDPKLDVLFPTPPFPSYPSAHATISNAVAVVLVHLFPNDAVDLLGLAAQAAASRCWAGIHFPIDDDVGQALGRTIGYLVLQRARSDGAE